MEFYFNINDVFKNPVDEIDKNLIPAGFSGDKRQLWDTVQKVTQIVNTMGEASARAQGLSKPITTSDRIRNSDNKLYFMVDHSANRGRGVVTGMLKTGKKPLYVFDKNGQHFQVAPNCILDFYIPEARQRSGLGKQLFEYMLAKEQVNPVNLAIDRPSEKLLNFLNKHYKLNEPIKQRNNFVVYNGFFSNDNKKEAGDFIQKSKIAANGLQMHKNYDTEPASTTEQNENEDPPEPPKQQQKNPEEKKLIIDDKNSLNTSQGYPCVKTQSPNKTYHPIHQTSSKTNLGPQPNYAMQPPYYYQPYNGCYPCFFVPQPIDSNYYQHDPRTYQTQMGYIQPIPQYQQPQYVIQPVAESYSLPKVPNKPGSVYQQYVNNNYMFRSNSSQDSGTIEKQRNVMGDRSFGGTQSQQNLAQPRSATQVAGAGPCQVHSKQALDTGNVQCVPSNSSMHYCKQHSATTIPVQQITGSVTNSPHNMVTPTNQQCYSAPASNQQESYYAAGQQQGLYPSPGAPASYPPLGNQQLNVQQGYYQPLSNHQADSQQGCYPPSSSQQASVHQGSYPPPGTQQAGVLQGSYPTPPGNQQLSVEQGSYLTSSNQQADVQHGSYPPPSNQQACAQQESYLPPGNQQAVLQEVSYPSPSNQQADVEQASYPPLSHQQESYQPSSNKQNFQAYAEKANTQQLTQESYDETQATQIQAEQGLTETAPPKKCDTETPKDLSKTNYPTNTPCKILTSNTQPAKYLEPNDSSQICQVVFNKVTDEPSNLQNDNRTPDDHQLDNQTIHNQTAPYGNISESQNQQQPLNARYPTTLVPNQTNWVATNDYHQGYPAPVTSQQPGVPGQYPTGSINPFQVQQQLISGGDAVRVNRQMEQPRMTVDQMNAQVRTVKQLLQDPPNTEYGNETKGFQEIKTNGIDRLPQRSQPARDDSNRLGYPVQKPRHHISSFM